MEVFRILIATIIVPLLLQLIQRFAQDLIDALLDDSKFVLNL